ncbi:MAG TPA: DUF4129 domain-containing protein [Longimicrobium sp.]
MPQAAPLPGAEQVRQALDHVYRRPEFAPPARSPVGDLLRAIGRWIGRAIDFLLPDFDAGAAGGRTLFWILVALMAAVGVAVVLHLAGVLPRAWALREAGGEREGGRRGGRASRADEWEERARKAAAAGRWREAALALYQALLLRLDERGAVRYDPSKTPGDYRREARRSQEAKRVLDGFLRGFEPVAFGARPLGADGYERLKATAGEGGAHG